MEAILLGAGDAFGMPRPACACVQCMEARAEPGEARLRSGVLLRTASEHVLLDCSPDILRQLERQAVAPDRIDGVVISHHHNDHCFGLHDLVRTRSPGVAPLRVHAGPTTRQVLRNAMPGLFRADAPLIAFHPWTAGLRVEFDGFALSGFETHHRPDIETTAMVLEFERAGVTTRVAYATDMGEREPSPRTVVEGVDLFVGDGTYLGAAGPGHPGTARMIAIARRVGAKRVAVTHVGHWGVSAAEGAVAVGANVAMCRDGDDLVSFLS